MDSLLPKLVMWTKSWKPLQTILSATKKEKSQVEVKLFRDKYYYKIISGFIITGGLNTGAQRKAEAFNPLTGRNCPLPDLTQEMNLHSQCGQLICKERSCMKINSMGFSSSASVNLSHRRSKHLCWSQPGGEVMLLGGEYSPYSSEVISSDGSSTRANRWSLAYKTEWVIIS